MLILPDHWVWDFWLADDGENHHAFFLQAPHSLGDGHRRHRAARIGHAVSGDLSTWTMRPQALAPGAADDFDATATWTGSVVRGDDGRWWMFYTGARFLYGEPVHANVESIGAAVSDDLETWRKLPGPVVRADPRWYETLGTSPWPEEAWRDPWVFRDPGGDGWHMLITARANDGATDDRGVIGHAVSADLEHWQVRPPLSQPGSGFAHLEVPQVTQVGDQWFLLFACTTSALSSAHAERHTDTGTWSMPITGPTGPFDVSLALPLTDTTAYSGRLAQHEGRSVLLTFANNHEGEPFPGVINDPAPVHVVGGELRLAVAAAARTTGSACCS